MHRIFSTIRTSICTPWGFNDKVSPGIRSRCCFDNVTHFFYFWMAAALQPRQVDVSSRHRAFMPGSNESFVQAEFWMGTGKNFLKLRWGAGRKSARKCTEIILVGNEHLLYIAYITCCNTSDVTTLKESAVRPPGLEKMACLQTRLIAVPLGIRCCTRARKSSGTAIRLVSSNPSNMHL